MVEEAVIVVSVERQVEVIMKTDIGVAELFIGPAIHTNPIIDSNTLCVARVIAAGCFGAVAVGAIWTFATGRRDSGTLALRRVRRLHLGGGGLR